MDPIYRNYKTPPAYSEKNPPMGVDVQFPPGKEAPRVGTRPPSPNMPMPTNPLKRDDEIPKVPKKVVAMKTKWIRSTKHSRIPGKSPVFDYQTYRYDSNNPPEEWPKLRKGELWVYCLPFTEYSEQPKAKSSPSHLPDPKPISSPSAHPTPSPSPSPHPKPSPSIIPKTASSPAPSPSPSPTAAKNPPPKETNTSQKVKPIDYDLGVRKVIHVMGNPITLGTMNYDIPGTSEIIGWEKCKVEYTTNWTNIKQDTFQRVSKRTEREPVYKVTFTDDELDMRSCKTLNEFLSKIIALGPIPDKIAGTRQFKYWDHFIRISDHVNDSTNLLYFLTEYHPDLVSDYHRVRAHLKHLHDQWVINYNRDKKKHK